MKNDILNELEKSFLKENYYKIDEFLKYNRSSILSKDEQHTACLLGLINTCRGKYKESFVYYFHKAIKTAEREYFRQLNFNCRDVEKSKDIKRISLDDVELVESSNNAEFEAFEKEEFTKKVFNALTGKEKYVIYETFFNNKTIIELAKVLGCTKQYICEIKKKSFTKLKKLRLV